MGLLAILVMGIPHLLPKKGKLSAFRFRDVHFPFFKIFSHLRIEKNAAVIVASVVSYFYIGEAIISVACCHEDDAKETFVIMKRSTRFKRSFNSYTRPVNCSYAMRHVPFTFEISTYVQPFFWSLWRSYIIHNPVMQSMLPQRLLQLFHIQLISRF